MDGGMPPAFRADQPVLNKRSGRARLAAEIWQKLDQPLPYCDHRVFCRGTRSLATPAFRAEQN